MNRQLAVGAIVIIGLAGTAGVASAVTGVGPASNLLGGAQHELVDFEASEPQCTDDVISNSSTSIQNNGQKTTITHTQNMSLDHPGVMIGEPSLERLNDSTYVLSVPTEESDGMAAQCIAYTRYEATMQIAAGDDPWRVIVEHDNETAITLYGDSNSSGASASASAGASVSG